MKKIILPLVLAIFSIALALYHFEFSSKQTHLLQLEKERNLAALDSLKYYKYKHKGDSFFIIGNYQKAYEYYQQIDKVFNKEAIKEIRRSVEDQIMEKEKFFSHLQLLLGMSKQDLLDYKIRKNNEMISKDSLLQHTKLEVKKLNLENRSLKDSLYLANQKIKNIASSIGKLEIDAFNGLKIFYAGDLANGKANGKGYGLYSTGGIYEGDWKNNLRHGKGKYTWKDGSIYEGDYYGDKRQGKGIYLFTSGEKYVGEWMDNKRSGKGTLYDKDGTVLVSGNWENDEIKNNGALKK
jgi:hypothetical protein